MDLRRTTYARTYETSRFPWSEQIEGREVMAQNLRVFGCPSEETVQLLDPSLKTGRLLGSEFAG